MYSGVLINKSFSDIVPHFLMPLNNFKNNSETRSILAYNVDIMNILEHKISKLQLTVLLTIF